ncbi:MAG: gamma-glutamylcyclotransferase [Oscillospiraceae bacterium]|nr:gamma-glutamylcyclotransferase [Oscillospiraceae bacterium]
MKTQLFAAYAINTNQAYMKQRFPEAKAVAKSWIYDHKLVFQGNTAGGVATIQPAEGFYVPVVIWEMGEKEMDLLNKFKGIRTGTFKKRKMDLEVNGEIKPVFVYTLPKKYPFTAPNDDYLALIAEGYKDFNFPIDILNEATKQAKYPWY